MTRSRRIMAVLALAVLPIHQLYAGQGPEGSSNDEKGAFFSENYQGTSNADGVVTKESSALGFKFNKHFQFYAGVPVYFVHQKSTTSKSFVSGMGNAFTGIGYTTARSGWGFSSDVNATAPTGSRSRGFSTGHATVDWSNTLTKSISRLTPYVGAGVANSVSDTNFFLRPFTSKGTVGHFEGGAVWDVIPHLSFGASGYAVRAHGEQEITSRVVTQQEQNQAAASTGQTGGTGVVTGGTSGSGQTSGLPVQTGILSSGLSTLPSLVPGRAAATANGQTPVFETQTVTTGAAAIANDKGFSAWTNIKAGRASSFLVGYSHSANYHFNSLFFGIGFRVGP